MEPVAIRDQIIVGLTDGNAVKDLFKDEDLTFIITCRTQEAAKQQRVEILQDAQVELSIQTIKRTCLYIASPPIYKYAQAVVVDSTKEDEPCYNLACNKCE